MLAPAVESYLAVRRAAGFALKSEGAYLKSFATFSAARGRHDVCSPVAIEWAGLARSVPLRARRLGIVIRFARYLRAENERHEVPPAIFGSERSPRPTPYILSQDAIRALVHAAAQSGYRTLRRATYSTLFALLACTGLRVSEAIRLRLADLTPDGLVIRCTKFRKSRLVPLHETARAGLERYLKQRRPYAPFDDHVFVSLRRKPLLLRGCRRRIPHRDAPGRTATRPGAGAADAALVASHLRGSSAPNLPRRPWRHHPAHGGAVDLPRA